MAWVNIKDHQTSVSAIYQGYAGVGIASPASYYVLSGRCPALERLPGDSRDPVTFTVLDERDRSIAKIEVAQGYLTING
jgi:hypothetical protein